MAGDDAQYQETTAGLGDNLADEIAGEQVTFTQTDAPAAATEANAIDAADDGYSVSVVDHLGDDANDTAKADSTWDVALAEAASVFLVANAQADKDSQIAWAQVPLGGSGTASGSIYIKETADAQLALTKSQADADLAWVKSKATADSGFLSDDASSWDGMVHTESAAVDTFAHTDDLAAKTEGDSIGGDEAGTLVPQAEADETQETGDATATGDFSTDEDQQAATEWQTLANQLGTPWAAEQAGEASAEASWASTEATNYEDYVSKLGTAETAYATSDAGQFTDEVTKIDAADQTDGDAAADADQTLTNTLADDETEVEQAAAGADNTYWVAVAQANHDFRVAGMQAWHDVETGGSFADYNTAMTAAANNQSLGLNAAIAQFHATVDPVTAITGQSDIDAALTHDTAITDLSLDDFTKTEQAQNSYSDLESGDYDTQQKADNQAEHDLTVADANAEAAAMAAFAQANPSPWADEAAAEAQAKATQTIAAADAELTMDNQAADGQASQEIAQSDAAAARDIASATLMHDQSVATAQQVHDRSTPTGVSVPDAITPPIDGTPPTLAADYAGGFEAGNLWLPDTTEDFISLPLAVPSAGEVEEPDAPGLVTDMVLHAMAVNGHVPYYSMLYGILDYSAPLPSTVPGLYFFDSVSLDSTAFYGGGNPNQSLPPGSAQAIAGTNWSNGQPTVTSTATQPAPSFFGQQAGGGGAGAGSSDAGGSGGTSAGKAPQQAQGPSSGEAAPADANPGGPKQTKTTVTGQTLRQGKGGTDEENLGKRVAGGPEYLAALQKEIDDHAALPFYKRWGSEISTGFYQTFVASVEENAAYSRREKYKALVIGGSAAVNNSYDRERYVYLFGTQGEYDRLSEPAKDNWKLRITGINRRIETEADAIGERLWQADQAAKREGKGIVYRTVQMIVFPGGLGDTGLAAVAGFGGATPVPTGGLPFPQLKGQPAAQLQSAFGGSMSAASKFQLKWPGDSTPFPKAPGSAPFSFGAKPGNYAFVQDMHGVVYILLETPFGHSHPKILGRGQPVAAAGGLKVGKGGIILEIDNYSGTFQFTADILEQVRDALQTQGANVDSAVLKPMDIDE